MNYNKLLKKIEEYISSFYIEHADARLIFHNYARAKEVVNAADKIAKHYQLDERSRFIVTASAWFRDTGYVSGNFESYEAKSAEQAEAFLRSAGAPEEDIIEIKKCIVATANAQPPVSLPEKIICDAETFYLGTSKFKDNQKLLRKEIEAIKGTKIGGNKWRSERIRLLENHQYYTDYCQSLLDKTRNEHLEGLKKKQLQKAFERSAAAHPTSEPVRNELENAGPTQSKKPAPPEKKPTRGIETMFRISSSNSQKISMMADNKAHIMISVNSIIISVVLGLIVGKLDENRHLIFPTLLLLIISVATIIYSILATRPKLSKGVFTQEEVDNKSVDLLFYGNFYKMDLSDYDAGMRKMMDDREFLYGSLISDIYWQGKVLGRKYKFLRISYNIFMYGIAAAVIAYAIAAVLAFNKA